MFYSKQLSIAFIYPFWENVDININMKSFFKIFKTTFIKIMFKKKELELSRNVGTVGHVFTPYQYKEQKIIRITNEPIAHFENVI